VIDMPRAPRILPNSPKAHCHPTMELAIATSA
jgi:hypothetical protein